MILRTLLIGLFSITAVAQVKTIDGLYGVNTQMTTNYIKNKGCYMNTGFITASGGSLTRNTTNGMENGADCLIDASASAQTYSWATYSFDPITSGQNCEAKFTYKGDGSLYKAYVQVGGTKVTTDLQLTALTVSSAPVSINFPCGAQPLTTSVVIESTSASAAAINVAGVYAGLITNSGITPSVTDWQAVTVTGTWVTNTTYTAFRRQIGDTYEYDVTVTTSGAPTATTLSITLPSTDVIDTAKLTTTSSSQNFGLMTVLDAGVTQYDGAVGYNSSTSVRPLLNSAAASFTQPAIINATTPITFGASDSVHMRFSVPIVGLTSSLSFINSRLPVLPTIQKFTSGSGTYTTPVGVSYIKVRMVGGGGSGGSSGSSGATAGAAGTSTTFGGFTAGFGQGGGAGTGSAIGSAGTGGVIAGSIATTAFSISVPGGNASSGWQQGGTPGTNTSGGYGGSNPIGAGGSAVAGSSGGSCAGYGSGGAGGGGTVSTFAGGGGGSGAFIEFIYPNPPSTISYSVGSGGAARSAGAGGLASSAACPGFIEITEFYQNTNAPVLVGSVTSNSTGAERVERLTSNSAGTILSQSGSWVSSITKNGTGDFTVNFTAGMFSATPTCVCSSINSAPNILCAISSDSNISTSLVRVEIGTSTTGANIDSTFYLHCQGPR